MDVNDPTTQALVRLADVTALRHRVLAGNLANADTPGYVRQDVPFEEQLAEAVKNGDVGTFSPGVQSDTSQPAKADGNNVQVDRELAEINKNALMHQMALQMIQTKLSLDRVAITGRA